MKNTYLVILFLLVFSCSTTQNVLQPTKSKQKQLQNHEFITGQWVETASFNRLKKRDILPPHPFERLSADYYTCIQDGKPYFTNVMTFFCDMEEDSKKYKCQDEYSKYQFEFNSTEEDTTLIITSQFQENEPIIQYLSKAPRAKSCDFEVTPGVNLRSGIQESYNFFYFEGKYQVKDVNKDEELMVEISSDFKISGFTGINTYKLNTFGTHLMLELYEDPGKVVPYRWKNVQYYVLIAQENGFDLHKTNHKQGQSTSERRYKVLDLVYEFRRM
ncbi:MAG: hypothetical protein AAFO07_17980 [Bacteroidota bacterium]